MSHKYRVGVCTGIPINLRKQMCGLECLKTSQFCSKNSILRNNLLSLPIHKMLLWSYKEDITQISTRITNQNIFLMIFEGIALKLEKVGPTLSSLNPCPSILPFAATDDKKRFQCVNIVLNNKTAPLILESN